MQYLVIIGLILFIYFFFVKKKPINIFNNKADKKQTPKADEMVECANCGVYAELDESFLSGTNYYCSKECLNEKK